VQEAGMISRYVESLTSELAFDRSLAQCVRREVEDHLWEAVRADPAADPGDAERRAIANFGDPHAIAAQFAIVSLAKQTRRLGAAAVLAIAGVYIAMKARVAWYAAIQLAISDDMRTIAGLVARIDSYATWLSIITGIAGWVYISSRHIPARFHPTYGKELRCFFVICAAAVGALIVSVISDGVLTALRLFGTDWSAKFLVPILLMAAETVFAGILVFHIRRTTQRTASTAAWLKA
jgi:hypothetical protein